MQKMRVILAAVGLTGASISNAQDRFANVEISIEPLDGAVYMMTGAGGNIGISAGSDGILMVDDQYAPLADKIAAALQQFGADSPKYIINTHYHGDHTGSNGFFNEQKGATIFAHDNVRIRLASDEGVNQKALPVVTYQEGIKFHFNGETIHVWHMPNAHTDGDSAIWFEEPDILHTGDLFFKNWFPFIDLGAGGNVQGYIDAVTQMIELIDQDTIIIPGHGATANIGDLTRFRDMIVETYAYVQAYKAKGKTEDQLVAEGLDEKWDSWAWQFITEERWIRTLYK